MVREAVHHYGGHGGGRHMKGHVHGQEHQGIIDQEDMRGQGKDDDEQHHARLEPVPAVPQLRLHQADSLSLHKRGESRGRSNAVQPGLWRARALDAAALVTDGEHTGKDFSEEAFESHAEAREDYG